MNEYSVYKHTSPTGKIYIGITHRKPQERWNHGKSYKQNKHFYSAIDKYGWDNFKHEVLFSGLSKEEACEKEKELIAYYKSNQREFGYNNSTGGENPAQGAKMPPEVVKRKADALRGIKRPETGAIISKAKKGKSNGLNGRTGAKCAKAGVVLQIEEATGEIVGTYYGYPEMKRQTGFALTPVKEAVYGVRKRAYGFLWRYEKRGRENVSI